MQDEMGRTALHYVGLYGQLDIFNLFIAEGADVAIRDRRGLTAFESANLDEKLVTEALLSIEIHPDRSGSAARNAIICVYADGAKEICYSDAVVLQLKKLIETAKSTGECFYSYDDKKAVTAAKADEMLKQLVEILNILGDQHILATKENLAFVCEFAYFFSGEGEYTRLSALAYEEKSVLKCCMEGQKQLRNYFNKLLLVEIAPNETFRVTAAMTAAVSMLLTGLGDNQVALILRDKKGNVSVTLIDQCTNLQFMHAEVGAMLDALDTLDVVTRAGSEAQLARTVHLFTQQTFSAIRNSKGTADIRTTKSGTVLLDAKKMQAPEQVHIDQLRLANGSPLSAENPLKNYRLTIAGKSAGMRMTERALEITSNQTLTNPTVVFNNGWTGDFPAMRVALRQSLQAGQKYWGGPPSRYTTLLGFFANQSCHFPDKSVELIACYAEDERSVTDQVKIKVP